MHVTWLLTVNALVALASFTMSSYPRKSVVGGRMVVLQQQRNREVIEQLKMLLGKQLGVPLMHYQTLDRRIPPCLLDIYLEQHVFRGLARDALGFNVRCFTSSSRRVLPNFEATANLNGFKLLQFNLSDIPSNEVITRAELRLTRKRTRRSGRYDMSFAYNSSQLIQQPTRLYELKSILHHHSPTSQYALSPVTAKLYTHRSAPWEAYDVTDVVRKWREDPSLNIGLALRDHSNKKSRVTDNSLPSSTTAPRKKTKKPRRGMRTIRQPVLVTYGDNGEAGQLLMATNRSTRRIRRRRSSRKSGHHSQHQQQLNRERAKKHCKRRPLTISFRDIGWDDWILAPKNYKAFYCDGTCPTYMRDNLNATNHAIVQSFVHSVSPELVSPPCCVPTELSPITILYVDEFEKVVLKTYNDMVVDGCGCR